MLYLEYMKIIFAQGNPGLEYKNNRHNAGFLVLDKLASKYGADFKLQKDFKAEVAEIRTGENKILLVKPQTFYNQTGEVAEKVLKYYKLSPESDILVIHDELALPFGSIKLSFDSRDAGNNGVKDITVHIGKAFHRLRIGVKNDLLERMDASDFVLSNFSKEEMHNLENEISDQVLDSIEYFIKDK